MRAKINPVRRAQAINVGFFQCKPSVVLFLSALSSTSKEWAIVFGFAVGVCARRA